MGKIDLFSSVISVKGPSVMIFTEGTVLGPKRPIDFFSPVKYVPIGRCVEKISDWRNQGARIDYLTSRKRIASIQTIKELLLQYKFPGDSIYYRTGREKYKDIVETVRPDILIEDDCRSIGGRWQMAITRVKKDIIPPIRSIVVKEFKGIDYLPDGLDDLIKYGNR